MCGLFRNLFLEVLKRRRDLDLGFKFVLNILTSIFKSRNFNVFLGSTNLSLIWVLEKRRRILRLIIINMLKIWTFRLFLAFQLHNFFAIIIRFNLIDELFSVLV